MRNDKTSSQPADESPFGEITESSFKKEVLLNDTENLLKALSSLRQSENKYRLLSNQLEAILDHLPGLVFYKDLNNRYIRVNKYVADAHKKEKVELEGVSLYDLYPKEQAEAYYQDDLAVLKGGAAKLNIEEPWQTDEGLRWVNTSKIPFVDENGTPAGIIGISMDITERKHSEERINDLIRRLEKEKEQAQEHALTDGLTGIANRRHFDITLQGEIDRLKRSKSPLSLIMLDIDFFKKFNDRYGHVAGDHCLKYVARVVKENVGRASDFVARYGGEEFAVVMPDTKTRGAQIVAERIRQAVAHLSIDLNGSGTCNQVRVSLGVVTVYPGQSESYEKIVDLADMALYRAKLNGRNRYEVAVHDTGPATPLEETSGFIELFWHEDFNSGNSLIDGQHKKLFKFSSQLLSALSGGSPQVECLLLIDKVLQETAQHFYDEENLLRIHRYPLIDEHRQIHLGLLAKAGDLSAKFKHGQLTLGELFTFLANDIIWHHMHVEDRKFFAYL